VGFIAVLQHHCDQLNVTAVGDVETAEGNSVLVTDRLSFH
jgi:hypothetical protein